MLGARISCEVLAVENDGAESAGNAKSASGTEGGAKSPVVLSTVVGGGAVLAAASAGLTPGGNVKPDGAADVASGAGALEGIA